MKNKNKDLLPTWHPYTIGTQIRALLSILADDIEADGIGTLVNPGCLPRHYYFYLHVICSKQFHTCVRLTDSIQCSPIVSTVHSSSQTCPVHSGKWWCHEENQRTLAVVADNVPKATDLRNIGLAESAYQPSVAPYHYRLFLNTGNLSNIWKGPWFESFDTLGQTQWKITWSA